jgi:hypothetical protein
MTRLCAHCGFFPVHAAQGYYASGSRCLYRLMGYDCRRFRKSGAG